MIEKNYFLQVLRDEFDALKELFFKNKVLILCLATILIVSLFVIDPIPARNIQVAFSGSDSGYALIARDQQIYLKDRGINLNTQGTNSSRESALLLVDPNSGVDLAFIQGGILDKKLAESIESLGSVAYEPVWIFYNKRIEKRLDHFKDLANLRVGIGSKDSGTWAVAKQLFALNNIDIESDPRFRSDSHQNNLNDFLSGKLDVVINVNPHIDPVVYRLLHEPTASLFELPHAVAYDKNLPFIKVVTLAASSIDIPNQIPPKDISLLATPTTLAVRKGVHPSLQMMVMMATKDAQRVSNNLFISNEEKFPAYIDPTIPISAAATYFYDFGLPQTLRYLPFWLGGFIDKMWLVLLTLLAIIYPLLNINIKLRTILYQNSVARIRRKCLFIDRELDLDHLGSDQRNLILVRLSNMREKLSTKRVPIDSESDYFDTLKLLNDLIAKAK